MKVVRGSILLGISLLIFSCDNPSNKTTGESVNPTTYKTVFIGQNIALMKFLAQKWQLTNINNIPVDKAVVMDFTAIDKGVFTIISECQSIPVVIDVGALPDKISVEQIDRKIKPCSDDFEDNLMSIVADIGRFDRQGDQLVLISFQDTLQLSPKSE